MPRCPVCQNRYVAGKDKDCPVCDWDLQTHPFYIAMIPEVAQKENVRLAWAVKLWAEFKMQQEQLKQARKQVEELDRSTKQCQSELEQNRQAQNLLKESSRLHETRLTQLQTEIERLKREKVRDITPSQSHAAIVKLQELGFQIAIVDSQGQSIDYIPGKAQFFNEDLGNGLAIPMVCLAGGTFLMGSPESEAGRDSHESPQHEVSLASFCLSQFPVTQAQWQAIASLPQVNRLLNLDPSNFRGADLPVEQISWYDAVEFCARLARLTGRDYRLPSEAEWEYACRAGTTTPFHFGETIASDLANYDASYTYGSEAEGQYRQQTTPPGSFQVANAFGLSDLHGNVWEWCADGWHEDYRDAPGDGSIWQTEETDDRRVLRGGSWYCLPNLCRSAQRHWDKASHGGSGTSFRIACSVPHF